MGHKILLVEDDADLNDTLADLLELQSYQVQTAQDGLEALELLDPADPPCMILLDLMMPRMDGWTFAARLRRMHEFDGVAVVLLSGISGLEEQAASMGAVAALNKPVEFSSVLSAVHSHC